MHKAPVTHWIATKRVLCCLKRILNHGSVYITTLFFNYTLILVLTLFTLVQIPSLGVSANKEQLFAPQLKPNIVLMLALALGFTTFFKSWHHSTGTTYNLL